MQEHACVIMAIIRELPGNKAGHECMRRLSKDIMLGVGDITKGTTL